MGADQIMHTVSAFALDVFLGLTSIMGRVEETAQSVAYSAIEVAAAPDYCLGSQHPTLRRGIEVASVLLKNPFYSFELGIRSYSQNCLPPEVAYFQVCANVAWCESRYRCHFSASLASTKWGSKVGGVEADVKRVTRCARAAIRHGLQDSVRKWGRIEMGRGYSTVFTGATTFCTSLCWSNVHAAHKGYE